MTLNFWSCKGPYLTLKNYETFFKNEKVDKIFILPHFLQFLLNMLAFNRFKVSSNTFFIWSKRGDQSK